MSESHEYIKVDIDMEVDYPESPGVQAPPTPSVAYVSYVIDTPGAKPGEEGLYDGSEVTSVPATSREAVEWQGAYRRFQERRDMAHLKLQLAEKAWREAMRVWTVEIQEAAAEYAPVHQEIEARKAMVEAQDNYLNEMELLGKKIIEAAALEAEDAVLGPRHWVVFYKGGDALRRTPGSRTLHTVDCRHVQNKPHQVSKPMRQADAQKFLADNRIVKRCGTCKPDLKFSALPRPTIPQQRSV